MRGLAAFFRANPQAFVLLVICVVLGLGTFIAVLVAIAGSGAGTPSGEPSGSVVGSELGWPIVRLLLGFAG